MGVYLRQAAVDYALGASGALGAVPAREPDIRRALNAAIVAATRAERALVEAAGLGVPPTERPLAYRDAFLRAMYMLLDGTARYSLRLTVPASKLASYLTARSKLVRTADVNAEALERWKSLSDADAVPVSAAVARLVTAVDDAAVQFKLFADELLAKARLALPDGGGGGGGGGGGTPSGERAGGKGGGLGKMIFWGLAAVALVAGAAAAAR